MSSDPAIKSSFLAQLGINPGLLWSFATVVPVLPKVINLDWENNDPTTKRAKPNPDRMGLYRGDYVVWRNHTSVALTIQFTNRIWPFSGAGSDITVAAGADSIALEVVDEGTLAQPKSWDYAVLVDVGIQPPGGPTVVVPSG